VKRLPASVALAAAMIVTAALATACTSSTIGPGIAGAGSSSSAATATTGAAASSAATGATTSATSNPPIAGATPSGLPGSVWISPAQIPLDASYHWQAPTSVAQAGSLAFQLQELCQTAVPASVSALDGQFTTATASMTGNGTSSGDNDWTAEETVTHDPSVDSASDQAAYGAFTDLVTSLKTCGQKLGVHMSVTTDSGENFAATVTIPASTGAIISVHDYVTVPDGTIVELALWTAPYAGNSVTVPWTSAPDSTVLSALSSPVCSSFKDC